MYLILQNNENTQHRFGENGRDKKSYSHGQMKIAHGSLHPTSITRITSQPPKTQTGLFPKFYEKIHKIATKVECTEGVQ